MFQAQGTIGAKAQQSEKAWLGEDFGGEGGSPQRLECRVWLGKIGVMRTR